MQFAIVILHHDCVADSTTVERVFSLELPNEDAADVMQERIQDFLSEFHDGDDEYRIVDYFQMPERVASADELMAKIVDLCGTKAEIAEEDEFVD